MESASIRKQNKNVEKPKIEEVKCLINEDDDY
jgi:hypothetical protein